MASWAEFERSAPDMADVAARLWPGITRLGRLEDYQPRPGGTIFRVAYLATTRPDGSPRLHPFCPIIAGGRLFAAIPARSPKGNDLRRDGRCAIHALPGPDDDELCIRARARDVSDDGAPRRLVVGVVSRSGVGGMIETATNDPLFEFDLEQVETARWLDIGQPGTRAVRQRWRAPRSPAG
jgi:Pyridoxamine 5'-phosphate oxidase